ncbi:MAG: hypothetical protein COT81_02220 [Candidatus Buchananbacteria bacterium CG10_big_fil_rev_8_21_14_0_10_42_9]|uniref:HTH HARE-type domain-containing protein n=1 Tax=Candidatus Buchananbacteria bacterium CG10_big_fil_rev_8_21_14_0_10_42_9 TaxID=1974526 RepID=A0A2H0W1G9_9BACT|nr:MAG: hypothetical protein COT81_02220 [Candidatus Buchananbacteria bacterium CG10_big_fil_rev_8_21_14_0_10_42_9]
MPGDNSIFDKIIASQKLQEASQFNPAEFLNNLLKNLNSKEREIITRRYGLDTQPRQTLEEIGKAYSITRERIRQIQSLSIKKLKELDNFLAEMEDIRHLVTATLKEHGGIMEHGHLVDSLLNYSENHDTNRLATSFILNQLLDDVDLVRPNSKIKEAWKLTDVKTEYVHEILDEVIDVLKAEKELLKFNTLLEKIKTREKFNERINKVLPTHLNSEGQDINKILQAYLTLSQKIDNNILDQWGLVDWPTVKPKRMSDKIYLIFRQTEKPLHFVKIADIINQAKFDQKIARPATIHNELILDDRFILVGRGIYALSEWGYKTGTVADVIVDILKNSDSPMSKEKITDTVLKQRMVKKSTIYLALTDKSKFTKDQNGLYSLVT